MTQTLPKQAPLSSLVPEKNVLGDAEEKIQLLDPSLFKLDSQTTTNDRVSFLRLQRFVRRCSQNYCYLEIGSHLGGSLLPHLADSRCAWAISIDPRPRSQGDERGRAFFYDGNSTHRMIKMLREQLPAENLRKLQTFDLDAAAVPRSEVRRKVQLALIDGEHTNAATFSDFLSIFPMLFDDAVIAFHDAGFIISAIQNVERFLVWAGVPFRSVFLPDNVAAIGLRGMGDPLIADVDESALDRERFIAAADRSLQITIAKEVFARELPYFSKRLGAKMIFSASRLVKRLRRKF